MVYYGFADDGDTSVTVKPDSRIEIYNNYIKSYLSYDKKCNRSRFSGQFASDPAEGGIGNTEVCCDIF